MTENQTKLDRSNFTRKEVLKHLISNPGQTLDQIAEATYDTCCKPGARNMNRKIRIRSWAYNHINQMLKDGFILRQKTKEKSDDRKIWHYYAVTSLHDYLNLPQPQTNLQGCLPEKIWGVLDLYCSTHDKDPKKVMADAIAHYILTAK